MATRKEIIDLQVQYGTLEGLESQLEQVNAQLKQTEIGSEAFRSLTAEAQKLNSAIENVNNTVTGIQLEDKLFAADGAIKMFAGSVEAVVGSFGLLGVESEVLGKIEEKAASAIALGMGLKDLSEGWGQLTQVIGKADIATKLFANTSRAALITTGVGAIAVLLGVIIANWEKVSEVIGLASEETEAYNQATEEVSSKLTEFTSKIIEVETSIQLAREGVISKKDALQNYNDILGESLGYAKSLDEAERNIVRNAPIYLEIQKQKAIAQIAIGRAAEASTKIMSGEALQTSWWQDIISVFGGVGTKASFIAQNAKSASDEVKNWTNVAIDATKETAKLESNLGKISTKLPITGTVKVKQEIDEEDALIKFIDTTLKKGPQKLEVTFEPKPLKQLTPGFGSYWQGLIDESRFATDWLLTNNQEYLDALERSSETEQSFLDARKQAYIDFAFTVADAIGRLGELFKEGTAAAKTAALSEIAINTAAGFVQGLDIAQKGAKAGGPAAPFLVPLFYAQQVAIVLSAAKRARDIIRGSSTTETSSGGVPTVSRPNAPGIGGFTGGQVPSGPIISPAIKTYVLSGDVRNAQEADAKISKKRILG